MNKTYTRCILLLAFAVFSGCRTTPTTRQNEILPTVKQVSKITNIKGWVKSPEGQWIGKKNIIPIYTRYPENLEGNEVLGIDNIISLTTYEVDFRGKKYFALIRLFNVGSFQYPSLQSGWHRKTFAQYLIVEDTPIDLHDGINNISVTYSGKLVYSEVQKIKDIQNSFYSILSKQPNPTDFIFNISLSDEQTIKFLFFIKNSNPRSRIEKYIGFPSGTIGRSPLDGSDTDIDILISPSLFEQFYFECDRSNAENVLLIK